MAPPPPGRDSTTMIWPVVSLTFLATMRCKVSALAPGVNGMMMVIGRDDRSSAIAGAPAIPFTATIVATTAAARSIRVSRHNSSGNLPAGRRG
jgi:hypothetical protein